MGKTAVGMKAKDKAKDLLDKSMPLAHDWESENIVVAKKIATLCVDEIIDATAKLFINEQGTGVDKVVSDYWTDVKREIDLL